MMRLFFFFSFLAGHFTENDICSPVLNSVMNALKKIKNTVTEVVLWLKLISMSDNCNAQPQVADLFNHSHSGISLQIVCFPLLTLI